MISKVLAKIREKKWSNRVELNPLMPGRNKKFRIL